MKVFKLFVVTTTGVLLLLYCIKRYHLPGTENESIGINIIKFNKTGARRTPNYPLVWFPGHDAEIVALENMKEFLNYKWQHVNSKISKSTTPIRSLIISTWRSGSSFLFDIVKSFPATIGFFEPLSPILDFDQINSETEALKYLEYLKSFFHCQLNSTGILKHLDGILKDHVYPQWYFTNITFMSEICNLHPVQTMKVVRLPLKFAEPLFSDESLNLQVVLLVRDPRAIMNSRLQSWILKSKMHCRSTSCSNPKSLCQDQVDNFHHAKRLLLKYPGKLIIVRYEDMCKDPKATSIKIMSHLNLFYHKNVRNFLLSHTRRSVGGAFSSFRNTSATASRWTLEFPEKHRQQLEKQNICKDSLKLWNYNQLNDSLRNQRVLFIK